jgi:hypothetical protein
MLARSPAVVLSNFNINLPPNVLAMAPPTTNHPMKSGEQSAAMDDASCDILVSRGMNGLNNDNHQGSSPDMPSRIVAALAWKDRNSQVDKIWSFIPAIYAWILVCDARTLLYVSFYRLGFRLTSSTSTDERVSLASVAGGRLSMEASPRRNRPPDIPKQTLSFSFQHFLYFHLSE